MNLKVLLPVLVFAAIVIVGIGFSSRKAPPGPLPALETVTELAGIKLGELPADTATAMGPPNGMTEPVIDHGLTRFDYVYSNLKLEVVFVGADKDSARAEIICTSAPWVKLLGFDIAANEKAVFERLGNTEEVITSNEGLVRIDS